MVKMIAGQKGKGKTKILLDRVNSEVKEIEGSIVYLDKSNKHMFELNNRVRLINVPDYMVEDTDEFLGFICGIISQDHDLQQMYFDSFLAISHIGDGDMTAPVAKLEKISERFGVDFILSVSRNEADIPESIRGNIDVSL